MDKDRVINALEQARGYLMGLQDADTWPEQGLAAQLIAELKEGVAKIEGWESSIVVLLPAQVANSWMDAQLLKFDKETPMCTCPIGGYDPRCPTCGKTED